MKKINIGTLLTAAGLLAAGQAGAAQPFYTETHSFERGVSMRAWPPENQKFLSLETADAAAGQKSMKISKAAGGFTVYGSMGLKEPGPGVMIKRFLYKVSNSKTRAELSLNFHKKGGKQGSAGRIRANIPMSVSSKYQTYEQLFDVPAESAGVQYLISFSGPADTVKLDMVGVSYMPDTLKVPVLSKMDFNADVEKNIWNARHLRYGFYDQGKLAQENTAVQLAADRSGLYFVFRNKSAAKPLAKVTERDGDVWNDDCNTVFLFDEKRQQGWQFAVNAANTQLDGELYQRVPGDPWRFRGDWNSNFKTRTAMTPYGWMSVFYIPYKALGIDGNKPYELKFNLARENKSTRENSTFHAYKGKFHDIACWGSLKSSVNSIVMARKRSVEDVKFAVKRPQAKFQTLLEKGTPGNYQLDLWTHGSSRTDFPKAVMARTSDEVFNTWLKELYRAWGEAGIGGRGWPWALTCGSELFENQVKTYNVKVPFFTHNSDHGRNARKNGAKLVSPYNNWQVCVTDPAYRDAACKFIKGYVTGKNGELLKQTVKLGMGPDEPSNNCEVFYNPALNKENIEILKEVDEAIRKNYGFGKFGSCFAEDTAEKDLPFARIAFYRYWNNELHTSLKLFRDAFKSVLPNTPYHLMTDNNVSGLSVVDVANVNDIAEIMACDPYPTSTAASYSMARAIYHTGFATRVLRDLVPNAKIITMPQCFIYHGRHGDKTDMREWASQALKNGAEHLFWYCGNAPWEIFDDYAAMLELSKFVGKMDKLVLPEKTKTLLWYSNFDKWAENDFAQHALYSVYVMLGEMLKSNFRMISDTSVSKNIVNLDDYKLLYVPVMGYTTPEISAKLLKWVENGGTMVVFDPRFMEYNIDGTLNADRVKLSGAVPNKVKALQKCHLVYDNKNLPAAMVANAAAPQGSRFESYVMPEISGGRTIMSYPDKTPAAVERKVGKGKVVYFAIQPFGSSALALAPQSWKVFFDAQAKAVGEKTDLPVWDFLLPEVKPSINLKKIIK
ncbi:MAG: hypothetical protein E7039_08730 [Lentisphaerae bacterium]|nr:hypothetical protein [Lentisphaerota bacterium]